MPCDVAPLQTKTSPRLGVLLLCTWPTGSDMKKAFLEIDSRRGHYLKLGL
jgi:hypothetical protein